MELYSKIDPDKLLHIVYKIEDIDSLTTADGLARCNVVPTDKFLQMAALKMDKGKTFKAHKHIYKNGEKTVIAQESWVVLRGSVKVFFYDLDDKLLATEILKQGDCSITCEGGHNYESQEDNTLVYEYKTGPYQGVEMDKRFLDE